MNDTLFGPHITAHVFTDEEGKITEIEIVNPNGVRSIKIPGEWAADITGSKAEIARDVSASLNGARVIFQVP